MRHLADEALLLLARTEEGVATGAIVTCFGNEAVYHFGASSTELRLTGATAYLQYEAMRLARAHNCTRFDMWGIPDEDPSPVAEDRAGSAAAIGEGSTTSRWASEASASRGRHPARRRWALWRRG
jgi:hypothetical protein